jgi:hypothetical protein
MPSTTMPCAICKEPMWKSRTSLPEGEAAHNRCRSSLPKEQRTRQCIDCGESFLAKDRRCGPCRYARAKAVSTSQCTHCDKPATAKGMCITHYTYEYRKKHGRKRSEYAKECRHCGTPFTTSTKSTAYCSLECAQRQRAGWSTSNDIAVYVRPAKPPLPVRHVKTTNRMTCGECRVCGEAFVSFHSDVTCSPECYALRKREARHASGQRRRALKRDAFVAPVFRKRVFESDGYRCHICNKMTKKTANVPHPMAPTIDHLVPLAKGGTHEPINCRTAHFMCNSIKGDRLAGDQLILFAM